MDWKMLGLLAGVTVLYYYLGKLLKYEMERGNAREASIVKTSGIVVGVGILLYFKYLDFFISSAVELLNRIGLHVSWTAMHIIMPIGVSFFIFKLMSYLLEIHRERVQPADSLLDFSVYIAFFPTILSGPIDRPNKFLPQIQKPRRFNFDKAFDGLQQILWGMFTKMVVADNLDTITSAAWNFNTNSGVYMFLAALLTPIQLYADFDGYSNMAIGVAKILGLDIAKNFNHPLLARNVSDYWRRWHMSLTSWITDYVFTPLNIKFRNWGKVGLMLAITINLIVIGMWHGANWTYVLFGLYHSLLFIPLVLSDSFGKNKKLRAGRFGLPSGKDLFMMILTFLFVAFGQIIFFAPDITSIIDYLANFSWRIGSFMQGFEQIRQVALALLFSLTIIVIEWRTRDKEYAIQAKSRSYGDTLTRFMLLDLIIAIIIAKFGMSASQTFVYFNF